MELAWTGMALLAAGKTGRRTWNFQTSMQKVQLRFLLLNDNSGFERLQVDTQYKSTLFRNGMLALGKLDIKEA